MESPEKESARSSAAPPTGADPPVASTTELALEPICCVMCGFAYPEDQLVPDYYGQPVCLKCANE